MKYSIIAIALALGLGGCSEIRDGDMVLIKGDTSMKPWYVAKAFDVGNGQVKICRYDNEDKSLECIHLYPGLLNKIESK